MSNESFESQFLREIKQPVFWAKVGVAFIFVATLLLLGLSL